MFHYTHKGANLQKTDEFKIWEDPDRVTQNLILKPREEINFEEPPRTSTPVPDVLLTDDTDSQSKNAYNSWKTHLRESPTKTKVRGTPVNNEEILSGHFDMRDQSHQEYYMPTLNKCFLNLLINGPPPLNLQNQHSNHENHWAYNSYCPPICNCHVELCNVNLPIGFQYDGYGNVVPSRNNPLYYRDPMCIYMN